MLTEQLLEQVPQHYVDLMSEVNSKYLDLVAEAIKRDAFSTYQQRRIINMVRMGEDITSIEKLLADNLGVAKKDISALFDEIAESEYTDTAKSFAEYRQMDYIPYGENTALQQQINAIKKLTLDRFSNLSNSIAVGVYWQSTANSAKQFTNLTSGYYNAVDFAIQSVSSGYVDPYYAIRNGLKTMASSGIMQTVYQADTGKTYVQSIEVAMRRNVLDGMHQIAQSVQDQVGAQYGADAKEISVHVACAPDHISVQGKIFALAEWEKIYGKGYLEGTITDINGMSYTLPYRGIGIWNCRHYAFSYMIGVSEPTMSDEEIKEINDKNLKGFDDTDGILGKAGEHYTIYDMTQNLRKQESAIRKLAYQKNALAAAGDTTGAKAVASRITAARATYKSSAAAMADYGIKADYGRMAIAQIK